MSHVYKTVGLITCSLSYHDWAALKTENTLNAVPNKWQALEIKIISLNIRENKPWIKIIQTFGPLGSTCICTNS